MKINNGKNKFLSCLVSRDTLSVLSGTAISLILFILILVVTFFYDKSKVSEQRLQVLSELTVIRAKLEGALISRLLLVKGLVSFVSLHPHISRNEFDSFAEALIGRDTIIKNITLLRNTTIIYAYPYRGNEKAIGIDVAKIPDQAGTVLKAIRTKETVIAGPVKLVQGGMGIISRMPIFIKSGNSFADETYWGQASTVIMEEALLKEAGLEGHYTHLKLSIRGQDGTGKDGRVFRGDESISSADPVTLDVSFPNGSWQLAAVPVKGWCAGDFFSRAFLVTGIFISLIAGFLLWSLLRTRHALKDMAFHDPLTGLPNRALFEDRFNVAVQLARRTGKSILIMMLDLNKFKKVNDELGHAVGDILLKEVAARLKATLRSSDTVVRFGGDEFVIMLQDFTGECVVSVCELKVKKAFTEPFDCAGRQLSIGTSIGSAVYPADGTDMDTLLKKADSLMYASKKR